MGVSVGGLQLPICPQVSSGTPQFWMFLKNYGNSLASSDSISCHFKKEGPANLKANILPGYDLKTARRAGRCGLAQVGPFSPATGSLPHWVGVWTGGPWAARVLGPPRPPCPFAESLLQTLVWCPLTLSRIVIYYLIYSTFTGCLRCARLGTGLGGTD